jgi:hypothetical protein
LANEAPASKSGENDMTEESEVTSPFRKKSNHRLRASREKNAANKPAENSIPKNNMSESQVKKVPVHKTPTKVKVCKRNSAPNDSALSESNPSNAVISNEVASSPAVSSSCHTVTSNEFVAVTISDQASATSAPDRPSAAESPIPRLPEPTPEQHRRIIDQTIISSINRNTIDKEKEDRDFELFCKSQRALELGVVVGSGFNSNPVFIGASVPKNVISETENPTSRNNNQLSSSCRNVNTLNSTCTTEPPDSPLKESSEAARTIPSAVSRSNNSVRPNDFSARNEVSAVDSLSVTIALSGVSVSRPLTPNSNLPPPLNSIHASSIPANELSKKNNILNRTDHSLVKKVGFQMFIFVSIR